MWVAVSSNELPIRPAPANYAFKDTLLGDLEPTRPFQRITGGASFKVTSDLRRSDVPPANIMDLRAVEGHVEIDGTPIVRLTWTWPGAHMTHGVGAYCLWAPISNSGRNDVRILNRSIMIGITKEGSSSFSALLTFGTPLFNVWYTKDAM